MTNSTKITFSEHKELNVVMFQMRMLPIMILYELCAVAFIVFAFVTKQYVLGGLLIAAGLILPLGMYLSLSNKSKISYQRYQELYEEAVYNFDFKDTGVSVELVYKGRNTVKFINYKDLKSIVETKKNFILFNIDGSAYIANKSSFDDSYNRNDLYTLLKNNVKKYRKMDI